MVCVTAPGAQRFASRTLWAREANAARSSRAAERGQAPPWEPRKAGKRTERTSPHLDCGSSVLISAFPAGKSKFGVNSRQACRDNRHRRRVIFTHLIVFFSSNYGLRGHLLLFSAAVSMLLIISVADCCSRLQSYTWTLHQIKTSVHVSTRPDPPPLPPSPSRSSRKRSTLVVFPHTRSQHPRCCCCCCCLAVTCAAARLTCALRGVQAARQLLEEARPGRVPAVLLALVVLLGHQRIVEPGAAQAAVLARLSPAVSPDHGHGQGQGGGRRGARAGIRGSGGLGRIWEKGRKAK